jgi:hypothetical protein
VKYWGATNEPDLRLKAYPTYAARVYIHIKAKGTKKEDGATDVNCPHCHYIAGEFNKDVQSRTSNPYVRAYMAALKARGSAHSWAFHTYDDVTNPAKKVKLKGDKKAKSYLYIPLRRFLADLDEFFPSKRNSVLLDEGGVQLRHGGANNTCGDATHPPNLGKETGAFGHLNVQTAAGFRFLGIGGIDRRIKLVSYYEMFGYPCSFDSAVVQPPDRPPGDHITLNGKNFRPVYCVLTNQTVGKGKNKDVADLCKHTGGN